MSDAPRHDDPERRRHEHASGGAAATAVGAAGASPGTGRALLEVRDLAVSFGGLRAVDGVSFDIEEGSVTALIGPNGAGKTTVFHLVSGFLRPDGGHVRFAGSSLDWKPAYMRARAGMVRTFQIPKVFAGIKVRDNLLLAANDQPRQRLSLALVPRLGHRRRVAIGHRADELLERFNLAHVANEYAGELSGGQRKLLEMARALMTRPRMLLLDEPLAGVNPTLGAEIFEHIGQLRRDDGLTFFYIEHDMTAVMTHSDRVICMAQGAVIADGTPEQVQQDPAVIDAYLGGADA